MPRTAMWLSWRPKQSLAIVESKDGIHWTQPPQIVLGPRKETGWEDDINRLVVVKRADGYPFGNRVVSNRSALTNQSDPAGFSWPLNLLQYMGGYKHGVEPAFFICPSEQDLATYGGPFRVNYQANQHMFCGPGYAEPLPLRAARLRVTSRCWVHIEKSITDYGDIKAGALDNPMRLTWNILNASGTFAYPQVVRHNWGMNSTAADGHAEWLHMPSYRRGASVPSDLLALGDRLSGVGSVWKANPRVKLFTRYEHKTADGGDF